MTRLRMPSRFCHITFCSKKPTHRCLECQQSFCPFHDAKRTTWGNFWLKEEESPKKEKTLIQVPFRIWQYLICEKCASIDHEITWEAFVEKYPFFLKHLDREHWKRVWSIWKKQRSDESGNFSFLPNASWARVYFPMVSDPLELECESSLESLFPFKEFNPTASFPLRNFSL